MFNCPLWGLLYKFMFFCTSEYLNLEYIFEQKISKKVNYKWSQPFFMMVSYLFNNISSNKKKVFIYVAPEK